MYDLKALYEAESVEHAVALLMETGGLSDIILSCTLCHREDIVYANAGRNLRVNGSNQRT